MSGTNALAWAKVILGVIIVGLVAFVGYKLWGYLKSFFGKAADTVKQAVPYVDPTSDKNIAYQAASLPAKIITGDDEATLGTLIYDVTHPFENAALKRVLSGAHDNVHSDPAIDNALPVDQSSYELGVGGL